MRNILSYMYAINMHSIECGLVNERNNGIEKESRVIMFNKTMQCEKKAAAVQKLVCNFLNQTVIGHKY